MDDKDKGKNKGKDKVLGTAEVGRILNRSQKTVCRYIREGRFKAARQGERGWWGVLESEVRAYLARCGFFPAVTFFCLWAYLGVTGRKHT